MTATRPRRKAARKKATPRKKTTSPRSKKRSGARRGAVKGKLASVKGRARTLAGKVRAIGAGLAAAGAAAVEALRTRPPLPPTREMNGASTEEERIEGSKYLPRHVPKRLFETERFVFPETYGVNRVRLLVKDPEWLFAHWDMDAGVMAAVRRDLGERAMALSRLTLRVFDPVDGGQTTILLPKGARGWYIRADLTPRSYRAELGLTLPTGEFRALAASNVVGTPRVGPSRQAARGRVRFDRSGRHVEEAAGVLRDGRGRAGRMPDERVVPERADAGRGRAARSGEAPGGASDTFRPGGASDTNRPGGASDTFRR
jgi:hypothetical protein